MQHALAALIPVSLPTGIPSTVIDAVRSVATRCVDRRMAGRPQDDREDVTQVAVMHALGSVCWDGADPRDAAALSARAAVQRFIQDAQSNGRELSGGSDADLDTLSDGNALGVATLAPSPDHMTRTDLSDVFADAMRELDRADPALHGALSAWLDSARSQDRRGSVPTLKGMLAKRVREVVPAVAAEIIIRNALQSGTVKRAERWENVSTQDADMPGGAFGIRDRSESGSASPVVVRTPIAGPACETCAHDTCAVVRAGRYEPLTEEQSATLGLTGRTGAYRATRADRAADDWAYALTPSGPVRKSENRKGNKGGGSVGTSTTVRGPRHAWGDKSA